MAIGSVNLTSSNNWIGTTDSNGKILPNTNICYGPYDTKESALAAFRMLLTGSSSDTSNDYKIPQGWTFGIASASNITEYVLKVQKSAGVAIDVTNDIVQKISNGGGSTLKYGTYDVEKITSGTNVTMSYNSAGKELTINSTGGGTSLPLMYESQQVTSLAKSGLITMSVSDGVLTIGGTAPAPQPSGDGETNVIITVAEIAEYYYASTIGTTGTGSPAEIFNTYQSDIQTGTNLHGWVRSIVPDNYNETNCYLWKVEISYYNDGTDIQYNKISGPSVINVYSSSGSIGAIIEYYCVDTKYNYGPDGTMQTFFTEHSVGSTYPWNTSYNAVAALWSESVPYIWNYTAFYSDATALNLISSTSPHIIATYQSGDGGAVNGDAISVDLTQENANICLGDTDTDIILSTRGQVKVSIGAVQLTTTANAAGQYFTLEYDENYSTQPKNNTSFASTFASTYSSVNLGSDEFCSFAVPTTSNIFSLGIKVTVYYKVNSNTESSIFHIRQTINLKEVAYDLEIHPAGFSLSNEMTTLPADIKIKIKKRQRGTAASYVTKQELNSFGTLKYSINNGTLTAVTAPASNTATEWTFSKNTNGINADTRTIYFELANNTTGYEDGESIAVSRDGETGNEGPGCEYIFLLSTEEFSMTADSVKDNWTFASEEIQTSYNPNYEYNTNSASTYQQDDYVPTAKGWTDDIKAISPTQPIQYISVRRLRDGVWSSFEMPTVFNRYVASSYSVSIDNDSVLLDDNTASDSIKMASYCRLHVYKGDAEITELTTTYKIQVTTHSQNGLSDILNIGLVSNINEVETTGAIPTTTVQEFAASTVIASGGIAYSLSRKSTGSFSGTGALTSKTYGIQYEVKIWPAFANIATDTPVAVINKIQTIQVKDINDGTSYMLMVTPNSISVGRTDSNSSYIITGATKLTCTARACSGSNITTMSNFETTTVTGASNAGKYYVKFVPYHNDTADNVNAVVYNKTTKFTPQPYNEQTLTHYVAKLYYVTSAGTAVEVDNETIDYTIKGDDGQGSYSMTMSNDTAVIDTETTHTNIQSTTLNTVSLYIGIEPATCIFKVIPDESDLVNDTTTVFAVYKSDDTVVASSGSDINKINTTAAASVSFSIGRVKDGNGNPTTSDLPEKTYALTVGAYIAESSVPVAKKTFSFQVKALEGVGTVYSMTIDNDVWTYSGDSPYSKIAYVTSTIHVNLISNGIPEPKKFLMTTTAPATGTSDNKLRVLYPVTLELYIDDEDLNTKHDIDITNTYSAASYTFTLYYNDIIVDSEVIDCIKNGATGQPGGKGDDAIYYGLEASSASIFKNGATGYSPSSIKFTAYKYSSSTSKYTSASFSIKKSSDNNNVTGGSSVSGEASVTLSSAGLDSSETGIYVSWTDPNSITHRVDVPIVSIGESQQIDDCLIRDRGEWKPDVEYRNDSNNTGSEIKYIDVVSYVYDNDYDISYPQTLYVNTNTSDIYIGGVCIINCFRNGTNGGASNSGCTKISETASGFSNVGYNSGIQAHINATTECTAVYRITSEISNGLSSSSPEYQKIRYACDITFIANSSVGTSYFPRILSRPTTYTDKITFRVYKVNDPDTEITALPTTSFSITTYPEASSSPSFSYTDRYEIIPKSEYEYIKLGIKTSGGYWNYWIIRKVNMNGSMFRYKCNKTHISESLKDFTDLSTTNSNRKWDIIKTNGPMYTPLIMADNAVFKVAQSNSIYLQDKDQNVIGGMSSYTHNNNNIRIFAGTKFNIQNSTSADLSSAPFRVYEDGTLVATNASITGAITATSGSFTGTINATSGSFAGTIRNIGVKYTTELNGTDLSIFPTNVEELGPRLDIGIIPAGFKYSTVGSSDSKTLSKDTPALIFYNNVGAITCFISGESTFAFPASSDNIEFTGTWYKLSSDTTYTTDNIKDKLASNINTYYQNKNDHLMYIETSLTTKMEDYVSYIGTKYNNTGKDCYIGIGFGGGKSALLVTAKKYPVYRYKEGWTYNFDGTNRMGTPNKITGNNTGIDVPCGYIIIAPGITNDGGTYVIDELWTPSGAPKINTHFVNKLKSKTEYTFYYPNSQTLAANSLSNFNQITIEGIDDSYNLTSGTLSLICKK